MVWPWSNTILAPSNYIEKFTLVIQFWNKGLWDTNGLAFAIQMMLMLLLGHVFALSPIVEKGIKKLRFRLTDDRTLKRKSPSSILRMF